MPLELTSSQGIPQEVRPQIKCVVFFSETVSTMLVAIQFSLKSRSSLMARFFFGNTSPGATNRSHIMVMLRATVKAAQKKKLSRSHVQVSGPPIRSFPRLSSGRCAWVCLLPCEGYAQLGWVWVSLRCVRAPLF